MKKLACLVAIVCVSGRFRPRAGTRARLNNQDVIEMVKLGLSDDVIIAKIRAVARAAMEQRHSIPAWTD